MKWHDLLKYPNTGRYWMIYIVMSKWDTSPRVGCVISGYKWPDFNMPLQWPVTWPLRLPTWLTPRDCPSCNLSSGDKVTSQLVRNPKLHSYTDSLNRGSSYTNRSGSQPMSELHLVTWLGRELCLLVHSTVLEEVL